LVASGDKRLLAGRVAHGWRDGRNIQRLRVFEAFEQLKQKLGAGDIQGALENLGGFDRETCLATKISGSVG
jgi:hypothetical protein